MKEDTAYIYFFSFIILGMENLAMGFPSGSAVKNQPANAEDAAGAMGSIPGLGRSPGEGDGYPLQYSYLENPMDRGAWQSMAHRVEKSQARLKRLSMHACIVAIFLITLKN